jgi:hypothetical protein
MINWPLVRVSRISDRIAKARAEEREATQKVADEKMERYRRTTEQNHKLDLDEKDAEIISRDNRIDQLIKVLHDTEDIFNQAVSMERKARRVATDVRFQVDHLMNAFTKYYQAINEISDRASRHEEETQKSLEKNRKRLIGDGE